MQTTMAQALPQSTARKNVRVVRMEPDVKSAETRKLFNAGVSGKSEPGKTTDPTCYDLPVSQKQEMKMALLTPKQIEMLKSFERDFEATDICDFDGPLGWHNRERVIDSLRRRLLLDDDGITPAGRTWLELTQR